MDIDTSQSAAVLDRIRHMMQLKHMNQAGLAKILGVDPGYISRLLSGRLNISQAFINRMVVHLGVSKEWLTEGTDVPFPRQKSQNNISAGAPVYDIDVTAGSTPLSRMFTDEHVVGQLCLPGINPELPIVRVSGDSMMPRIMPGAYISIRPVDVNAPILWGSIYVVVLADYRRVKYVRRNADPAMVTLHSANSAYEDIEVPRNQIEALYIVEHIINHDNLA